MGVLGTGASVIPGEGREWGMDLLFAEEWSVVYEEVDYYVTGGGFEENTHCYWS